jgi:hypothetical protein
MKDEAASCGNLAKGSWVHALASEESVALPPLQTARPLRTHGVQAGGQSHSHSCLDNFIPFMAVLLKMILVFGP